jgi:hypothetical protein
MDNYNKCAADMTVEELQVYLAEMNHEVINFNQSYADKMKYNGPKSTRTFRGSGSAMRRRAAYGNTFNGGRK